VAGGLDWLVQTAERLMRRHPQQITILAPLSTSC
jgi:anaerobic C4-dicarboxylate transporter DcuB